MSTLLIAALSFFGFLVAYHTYGRWLARKIFRLDAAADVPSRAMADGVDFVPTRKEIVFGHHFTSIAGTGPIVGPAIAVFWGWLPALLWVVLGSIFIGAVHDLGALVVSVRNRGMSLGEAAGRVICPRARFLFLLILLFELTIVLAVFGLVIALIFAFYPESVLSVWIEIPLAVAIGFWVYKKHGRLLIPSLLALAVMYAVIWVGTRVPVDLSRLLGVPVLGGTCANAVVIWTLVLFAYCFVASVLPVWTLLQPRDYINSHELLVALGLLCVGLAAAGLGGQADMSSAPAVAAAADIPADAPPIMPFLFITVACGAISGFHCLVGSGTSSKQLARETDAHLVGYGAMLLEGALAVVVILACCAGVGMGRFDRTGEGAAYRYAAAAADDGGPLAGAAAWKARYNPAIAGRVGGWKNHGLKQKIGAFIEGGANFLTALGIPLKIGIGILAVLVASFAATTLDTATRLQRYVIQELSAAVGFRPGRNKYLATGGALAIAGAVAVFAGAAPGKGGMTLWPLFGASNQLLAGLAFMVIIFFLLRRRRAVWFAVGPMVVMLVVPTWAMLWQMFNARTGWLAAGNWPLLGFAVAIQALTVWMVVEGLIVFRRLRRRIP